MRFVLVSTHIDQTTGYSKVSYNLVKQLATLSPATKTFHFGFQRHPSHASVRKYPEGVVSYDAAANEDPKEEGFGFNKIHEYLDMVNPDVVMIYNDPITIHRFLESMKHEKGKSPYKLWLYVDQVYEGIAQSLMDSLLKHADRIYAFSEYWKTALLTYGSHPDVKVMEHAVDPMVYTNMTAPQRKEIRRSMNIPDSAVVFLNANRNSERKRLDLTLGGFARILVSEPNAYLIVASNLNPQAGAYYDLQRIFAEELKGQGLDVRTHSSRLMLVDTSPPNLLDDGAINQLYNISDIGVNTSNGEGFGLCQLEHMYTGSPQLVTDVGTYSTFLPKTVATYVPNNGRAYFMGNMPHGGWYPTFSMDTVAECMRAAIRGLPEARQAAAEYQFKSWASVCDGWLEDVITQAGGPATSVSVPVTS
jgi:glycosyltransferase involved in cell wall biosynthesis